jgi:hypothetical protein
MDKGINEKREGREGVREAGRKEGKKGEKREGILQNIFG